jgi:hypothetical protein
MLQTAELERVAAYVSMEFSQAQRGAVYLNNQGQQSVIVFGNDGYSHDANTPAAVAKARAALVADGYMLSVVATEPGEKDTWVFEAVPGERSVAKMIRALTDCSRAVWEGWAAVCDLDSAESDSFGSTQMATGSGEGGGIIDLEAVLKAKPSRPQT